ncbi:MAG: alkaline phosphatase family protein [Candidatus Eiseniibacteriota bacterium]
MNQRSDSGARTVLEGLTGGAASGAFLLAMERSPTFNIFADVLNAVFRVLATKLPEALVVRLDSEPVAVCAYMGGAGLLGAAVGAAVSCGGPLVRALLIGLLLAAAEAAVLGSVWRHRALSPVVGAGLVALAGLVAAFSAWLVGALVVRRLGARAVSWLAVAAPAAVAVSVIATVVVASGGPRRPAGIVVDAPLRDDSGVKLAIVGIDGLDWALVDRAVTEGRMPHLARLLGSGVRGPLRSIRPPKSPVVWTSVATGMLPSVHGIVDFVVRREGQRIPVSGNLRRAPALWNLAEACGFRVAFVNWYVTWPAEDVAGTVVSDRADYEGLERRVTPESLTAAVDSTRAALDAREDRDIARFTQVPGSFAQWREGQWGQVDRALRILDDVVRHDLLTLEAARVSLRGGQPDLTALYFRGNDNTQHLFWKHRFANGSGGPLSGLLWRDLDPEEVHALATVVDRYYDFADELLGETLAMLEPDTAVLLLSDHGFLTNNERSRWFHANRVLVAAGLAVASASEAGEVDRAASLLADPEPPSIVARRVLRPGGAAGDTAATLARARDLLAAARTDAGDPLFDSVVIGADGEGPLLEVVFRSPLSGESARLGGTDLPVADFTVPEGHSGNHRMNGLLVAAGPPFRREGRIHGARVVDVAPTVLHALGAPAARDMEGVVLTDLFDKEWLARRPVRYVESFGLRTAEGDAIPTEADERIREELEALGYIR